MLLPPPVTHLFRLSLDGKQLAFSPLAPGSPQLDLLAYDLESNQQRVLTGVAGINHWPVWSPDGSRFVFDSNRTGVHLLYEARADGARPERLLLEPEPGVSYGPLDWSRDGSVLIFQKQTRDEDHVSIWALPMTEPGAPFRYLDGLDQTNAALSPDKKWLAYVAQEGGTHQVFAQSFPDPSGGKHLLSREGGAFPRWSRDGRELYYFAPGGWIIAVPLDLSGRFDVASSKPLFRTGISFPALSGAGFRGPGSPYDVTPDGRFLVMLLDSAVEDAPITVVLNWTAELEH